DQGCGSGDGFARLRRRDRLAPDGPSDRDPLRITTAIGDGPSLDDFRADRNLCSPDLDRPDLRLRLRVQARVVPDLELLQLLQPPRRVRGPRSVGLPPGPALADVRDPLRRAVRP